MRDYHDLYLKCDVLLLADLFEKFRNKSLKNYGLCPIHYLSAPALSWNVMLNMTKVEIELISDADMHLFFEKSMIGGVSYIFIRYGKANNKYLKSYDPQQESKRIIYLDANNIYGCTMSKLFHAGRFKCIDPKEFGMDKYTCNSSKGFILAVDLQYPKEFRELHNDYPLAPDKIEIKKDLNTN